MSVVGTTQDEATGISGKKTVRTCLANSKQENLVNNSWRS